MCVHSVRDVRDEGLQGVTWKPFYSSCPSGSLRGRHPGLRPLFHPATARAPRLSRCSQRRPSPGGPSLEMAQPAAPGSSHRTRPGRRRGSGGWRGEGRTPCGTRCRSGCPGRGPSRPGELRLSPGLDARKIVGLTPVRVEQQKHL